MYDYCHGWIVHVPAGPVTWWVELFCVSLQFPVVIPLFDGFPLIVELFTFAQPYFHFSEAAFIEENAQGNNGVTLFFHFGFNLSQFLFLQ